MSRHRFAREGIVTNLDRNIEIGAIEFPEDPVPVVWMNDFSILNSLMGGASDFRREEDGWITAEILWNPNRRALVETDLDRSFFLTIFGDQLTVKRIGSTPEVVTHCRLRNIFTTLTDPWQEAPSG